MGGGVAVPIRISWTVLAKVAPLLPAVVAVGGNDLASPGGRCVGGTSVIRRAELTLAPDAQF